MAILNSHQRKVKQRVREGEREEVEGEKQERKGGKEKDRPCKFGKVY